MKRILDGNGPRGSVARRPTEKWPVVLHVTITKTADGKQDYIQVMSADAISVNVVLVADRIEVRDARGSGKATRSADS